MIRSFWMPILMLAALAGADPVVGPAKQGHIAPTRHLIRPAGANLEFAGRPTDLTISPDRRFVYLKDNRGLVVVDNARWIILQELPFGKDEGGSMHGIAVSKDGRRIYATTAQNSLREALVGADGTLTWGRQLRFQSHDEGVNVHPCGIALSEDDLTAYVCLSRNNSLGVVQIDPQRHEMRCQREIPVGVAPFDVVLLPGDHQACVSNWGGRHPTREQRQAPSSGTPVAVDQRGVGSSGTVSLVDLQRGEERAQIDAGLHASDLVLDRSRMKVYVANANSDTVTIVDLPKRAVVATVPVRPEAKLPFGSMPNALALDEARQRLYVALAGNNAIAVLDVRPEAGLPSRAAYRSVGFRVRWTWWQAVYMWLT